MKGLLIKIFSVIFFISIFLNILTGYYYENNDNTEFENDKCLLNTSSYNISISYDWYKTWGGSDNEWGRGIVTDNAKNLYVVGKTESFGEGSADLLLIKFDKIGNQIWNKTWGKNNDYGFDIGLDIAIDSDENLYVVGATDRISSSHGDSLLLKFDNSGNELWNKTFSFGNSDMSVSIKIDPFNNIYILGISDVMNWLDTNIGKLFFMKFDPNGSQLWNKTINNSLNAYPGEIMIDSFDKIYLSCSFINLSSSNNDIFFAKYNSTGKQLWNHTFGTTHTDLVKSMILDSVDNIIISGNILLTATYSTDFNYDFILVKFNNSGVELWNKTWSNIYYFWSSDISIDLSDDIYLCGYVTTFDSYYSNIGILKFNSSGCRIWNITWGGLYSDIAYRILVNSTDDFIVLGESYSYGQGSSDIVLIKFGKDSDSDNISDWREINQYLTNPHNEDTDDDMLTDYQEIEYYNTNPNSNDTDADKVLDYEELIIYHTNPNEVDSDKDGFSDFDEIYIYFTDPNNRLHNPNTIIGSILVLIAINILLIGLLIYYMFFYRQHSN